MQNSIKRIENLLRNALVLETLEVIDESNLHAGHHAMLNNTHEVTHVYIKVASPDLRELARVEQHRRLYNILRSEIDNGLHSVRFQIT